MADELARVRSLPLGDLLGGAMVAVVQADALAARATLDFVQEVGFVPSADPATTGSLRMAAFRYQKRDEDGQVAEFVTEVPLLSLVSVPSLQVKEAKFSFIAKIDEIRKSAGDATAPARTELLARPAATAGARTEEVRSSHHLEVQVTMAQADVTVGLERIFQLMDEAIRDSKVPPP
jgi:hypothetical protein